jgi:tRNA-specific 2-thiouridylase
VIRYQARPVEAEVSHHQNEWMVILKTAQRAVNIGQSIVFYHGQELLGGGIISKIN